MNNKNNPADTLMNVFRGEENEGLTYRVSHQNINDIKLPSRRKFQSILFDSNLNCNLHCIYCHNYRDLKLVKEEDFINFLDTQVLSVVNFQIGCAMEPTMDKRMLKFIRIVSESHARPTGLFRIQTNGILLRDTDVEKAVEYGVNRLCVSIDTIDPEIHKYLRGGSDINKIINNIKAVRKRVPSLETWFITTVHSQNINSLEKLVDFAAESGVSGVEFRKMFYYPQSNIIQKHDDMKKLMLENKLFLDVATEIRYKWHKKINFCINDENMLNLHKKREVT